MLLQSQEALYLVLELPGNIGRWAIEIKRGPAARPSRGFHRAREDANPAKSFIVHSGDARYPVSADIEAIGVRELEGRLADL